MIKFILLSFVLLLTVGCSNNIQNDDLSNNENIIEQESITNETTKWTSDALFLSSQDFSKDDLGVYLRWEKIEWIDSNSFVLSDSYPYAKDNNNVYYYHWYGLSIISWANVDLFQPIDFNYAKDNNNVYYSSLSEGIYNVEWIDVDSFVSLWDSYVMDKNNVYFKWNKIDWANIDSFIILSCNSKYTMASYIKDCQYSKDNNNVYYYWTILEWADPSTFEIIDDMDMYTKDNNNVYFEWKKMDWVDIDSFESWLYDWEAKDAYNSYYNWELKNNS